MTEVARIIGPLFSTVKFSSINFFLNGWATFWANFYQTHLVTLVETALSKSTLQH
jgi:hypothetical protein